VIFRDCIWVAGFAYGIHYRIIVSYLYRVLLCHVFLHLQPKLHVIFSIERTTIEREDWDEDFGIQEQTSTELVHCIYYSSQLSIINMQQPCSSCLARRTLSIGGIRTYGAVPKPLPRAKPAETTAPRPSRGRFGLSDPSASDERVNRPHGTTTNGENSKARSSGSRRSRLAGFLDDGGAPGPSRTMEDLSRTPKGTMTSGTFRTGRPTQTDSRRSSPSNLDTSVRGRKPLYPSHGSTPVDTGRTRQSIREPLYPSPQPSQSEEPSSSRKKVSHPMIYT